MKVSTERVLAPLQGADGIFPAGCPSRTVLDHVSSKWGVLILVALWNGPQRWSELRRRAEGISEKMLAQTLRTLEGDGFLHRDAQPVIPPRVDYRLSGRGRELVAVLLPLVTWIAEHADEIVSAPGAPGTPGSGEAVDTTVAADTADTADTADGPAAP